MKGYREKRVADRHYIITFKDNEGKETLVDEMKQAQEKLTPTGINAFRKPTKSLLMWRGINTKQESLKRKDLFNKLCILHNEK